MSRDAWDPAQYGLFAEERSRAFFELAARVRVKDPLRVVDLGCGDGELTASLAARWPGARVEGVDSSRSMIEAAARREAPGVTFREGDLRSWEPDGLLDVLFSNAALQWVPDHTELFPRWVEALASGGVLAFQVPGNQNAPGHVILRELCAERGVDAGQAARPVEEPAVYLERLGELGCSVDAWETTYLQVLHGPDPVLEWMKGTTLRPVLAALADPEPFLAEFGRRLRAAYPGTGIGTIFPFRRVFVVARRP